METEVSAGLAVLEHTMGKKQKQKNPSWKQGNNFEYINGLFIINHWGNVRKVHTQHKFTYELNYIENWHVIKFTFSVLMYLFQTWKHVYFIF